MPAVCSRQPEHCTGRERFGGSMETYTQPRQPLFPDSAAEQELDCHDWPLMTVPAGRDAVGGSREKGERDLMTPWALPPQTP